MNQPHIDGHWLTNAREFAVEIAYEAGKILRDRLHQPRELNFKGAVDLVTDADKASESLIANSIRTRYPDHRLMGEEGSHADVIHDEQHRPFGWIVDPLDGTTNYAHRYPHFAVSIALEHEGEVQVGAVYDPMRDEMFSAQKDIGAFLNGNHIHVSEIGELSHGLLATGFSYNLDEREEGNALWKVFNNASQGLRRDGAAALNMCYVAAGRLDGYFERPVQPWDMAAALLIVQEAGGTIGSFSGAPHDVYGHEIITSNGLLHEEIRALILQTTGDHS